ncbi:MAG TPA: LamG-like jellyroll fold domain-containing protein [Blastocatellia bacterium]|nr:LamG-like jellyroll fold domain-containing protein [Blastocatellia bacterium]
MSWHIRRWPGLGRSLVVAGVAAALVTLMALAGGSMRADSQEPQSLGLGGDVTVNAGLTIVGEGIGARIGSNGPASDFTSSIRAHAIAVGDFNGDGIPDIAIGAPDQTVTIQPPVGPVQTRPGAGAVYVIFGSSGLVGTAGSGKQIDTGTAQPDIIILGANAGDGLGFSLAAGDVNNDGKQDLIMGAPGASFNNTTRTSTGAVFVLFGAKTLTTGTTDLATPNAADIEIFGIRTGDQFGASVAVADVGGLTSAPQADQMAPDMVIGAPGFAGPAADRPNAGGAFVVFGGSQLNRVAGVTTLIDIFDPTTPPGVEIVGAAAGNALGTAVATGVIHGTTPSDILVGAPLADRPSTSSISGLPQTGAVYGIFGGSNLNPTAGLPKIFDMGAGQDSLAIYGASLGDRTGASIATGDVTGDNNPDVVIGAPFASGPSTGPRVGCGDVWVIGGGARLNPSASFNGRIDLALDLTNPTSPSNLVTLVAFGSISGDHLGTSVGVGDYNFPGFADNIPDLLMGAPGANGGAGQVSVIFGGPTLLASATRDLQTNQDDVRVIGKNGTGGGFLGSLQFRETLTTPDTRVTPLLLDVTAQINGTPYTETTVSQFAADAGPPNPPTVGVRTGNTGDGDLELAPNPGIHFNAAGAIGVAASSFLQPGTGSWTVEFWVNNYTTGVGSPEPIIGSSPFTGQTGLGWYVAADHATHVLHLQMGDGTSGFDVTSNSALGAGLQHWAVVFDRANTQVLFYLNGVLDATRVIQSPNTVPGPINQLNPAAMGSDLGSGGSRFLNATIDDPRIYNAARTGPQIAGDFANELTGTEAGLQAYWTFNEGSGTTVHDTTLHANTGTLAGGAAFTTATGGRIVTRGVRISPNIPAFSAVTTVTASSISWNTTLPSGTGVKIETSLDGGTNYLTALNGGPIPGIAAGDGLGWVVAAADVNNDTKGDLIVGAPGADVIVSSIERTQAGAVYVLAGFGANPPPPPPPNQNHPPTVSLTAPVGGESLLIDQNFNITWTASDPDGDSTIQGFAVDLSTDGGATFGINLAGNLPGTTRAFPWTVPPNVITTHGRIKVTVTDDHQATATSTSAADFTISDVAVTVTLTSPVGGEVFKFGQSTSVTWTIDPTKQSFLAGFDLKLSTDGGVTFPTLIANGADPTKPALPASSSSFTWTVPSVCTTNAKIMVVATTLTGLKTTSVSPGPFTINDYGPSVNTSAMAMSRADGQMALVIGTPAAGPIVPFAPDATLEVSNDAAGTQFFRYTKRKLKAAGHKLFTRGKLANQNPNKFFPEGAQRVLRISNPPCAMTLIKVMRHKDTLVLIP